MFGRTLRTLAIASGLSIASLSALASNAWADGVRVLNPDGSVRTEQANGYVPQGDVASEVAAALGLQPNQLSYERWIEGTNGQEGMHELRILEGEPATAASAPVATPVPTSTAPVTSAAANPVAADALPGHGQPGVDTLVVSVGGKQQYFTVPTGTDHGAYVGQQFPGRNVSWDRETGSGTDDYTAYLTVE
jgi:hypothetical protein